jgi:N-acetylglucosaminyldiphosphoundecaprenol N-acetyl-beta-D-mannosaminyltransferase
MVNLMDDFDRNVYCLVGLPFDAVDMHNTLSIIRSAAKNQTRCFLSTPNLNFLIASRSDAAFRNSVIQSNLVVADGMPLIWMAKFLRIPIRERVAGSSLFEALRDLDATSPISVYFFGGPDGVAETAAQTINQTKDGLTCVGYQSPGFVSVDAMSSSSRIDQINKSNADFLVVSLGAKKGQSWIVKNISYIKTPIISHLGAVVNFAANRLERAPRWMQNIGMEWLWRIKEEPVLLKRYMLDGFALLNLLVTLVIPQALWLTINQRRLEKSSQKASIRLECNESTCRLIISGVVLDPASPETRSILRQASLQGTNTTLDLTDAEFLSPGFLGLILLLKKNLDKNSVKLSVVGVRPRMQRLLKWNGLDWLALLDSNQ